jgi:hypothetical protein
MLELIIFIVLVLLVLGYIGKLLAAGSAKEAGEQMQTDAASGLGCLAGIGMKVGDIMASGCCCYFVIVFGAMVLWPLIGPWSIPLVLVALVVMYIVGKKSDGPTR